jgi:pSer/pThr/pTyr-binding forkhead associated (FHA) protein
MAESPRGQAPTDATRLESDDEIRHALQARLAQLKGKVPSGGRSKPGAPVAGVPVAEPEPDTPAEKPQQRPPLALLCILDDGKLDGEWVRLRGDRCLIGRVEGEVIIPHDPLVSSRHAEIVRQKHKDGYRWVLTDLQSRNGTWVRIGNTVLRDQNELLIGRSQFRFEASGAAPAAPATPAAPAGATLAWPSGSLALPGAALVDITPGGTGQRIPLTQAEYWIGRDPRQCAVARPDDPFANPRHARLHRDGRGQWFVENNKSVNGLWLRIDEIPLGGTCQFRLGEQRFLFRVS